MKREDVYELIDKERYYQDLKWGGPDHDRTHSVGDWIVFMDIFLEKAKRGLRRNDTEALVNILKLTSLGVAALESAGDVDDNPAGPDEEDDI
jgi:hypothetical protein